MKLFLLAAFAFIVQSSGAQTYLTIIGTQHNPTDNINSSNLADQLNKIKPDVILMELDSSLMNDKGDFLVNSNELEPTAVKKHLKNYPTALRPFDYKNRNKFYAENKVFDKENKFFHTLDSVYNNNLLDSLSLTVYQNLIQVNNILNLVFTGDLKEINSPTAQSISRLRQDICYNQLLGICYRNKYLNRYAAFWKQDGDFWTFRNRTMIDNILKYCAQFKGKRIVVLTGAMHKYFLTDGIEKKQQAGNITLKEFWEYIN